MDQSKYPTVSLVLTQQNDYNKSEVSQMDIQQLKEEAYKIFTDTNFIHSVRIEALKVLALLMIAENLNKEEM